MADESSQNEILKRQILDERKEVMSYQNQIKKQSKKVKDFTDIEESISKKRSLLQELQKNNEYAEILEKEQLLLVEILKADLEALRKDFPTRQTVSSSY